MTGRLTLYVLTCGPFVLTLGTWMKIYLYRKKRASCGLATIALVTATANAAFAAGTFLYYELVKPSHSFLPPWEDPEILQLGMLFFFAPASMILGLISLRYGSPKWLVFVVEIASLPLFGIGLMAGLAV